MVSINSKIRNRSITHIYELLLPKAGNRLFSGSALFSGRPGTGAREGSEGRGRSSDTVRLPDSVRGFSLQAEEQGEAENAALGRGGSLSELCRREGRLGCSQA